MAEDFFARYYTEKLWETIPPIYRHEDGLGQPPGVLRGFVEAIAGQLAVVRRSHDRLWDDRFVELADSWAIPYLGDLVATRLVSVLDARGRRADVAKTIYYRRRRGTLAVVEELMSDIAGWRGVGREGFRRLLRAPHRLDRPGQIAGGGVPDLRTPLLAGFAGGPFDPFHHAPDLRFPRGRNGRYGISRLALHLWRLAAVRLSGVTPAAAADAPAGSHAFTFDPSGRDVPLFAPSAIGEADDWQDWRPAEPYEVPAPIACRLLNDARFRFGERALQTLLDAGTITAAQADALRPLVGRLFPTEARFRLALGRRPGGAGLLADAVYRPLAGLALLPACGRAHLLSEALRVEDDGTAFGPEVTAGAQLAAWTPAAGWRLLVDPERGRFLLDAAPDGTLGVIYHVGMAAPIGAGGQARAEPAAAPTLSVAGGGGLPALPASGRVRITDSRTYSGAADVGGISDLTLYARSQQRPYIRLGADWTFATGANTNALLTLDGLWLGGTVAAAIILAGDFEIVRLTAMTLDPGGARTADAGAPSLPPLTLRIAGRVERLELSRCIAGRIEVAAGGQLDEAAITDSIIDAGNPAGHALAVPRTILTLARATIIGGLSAGRLSADAALVTGPIAVADAQASCFRFSAAAAGEVPPRPYRSHVIPAGNRLFRSRRFGDPHYARLAANAPAALFTGTEDGSEIGAFASLRDAARLRGLFAKLEEYLPFGMLPVTVFET